MEKEPHMTTDLLFTIRELRVNNGLLSYENFFNQDGPNFPKR